MNQNSEMIKGFSLNEGHLILANKYVYPIFLCFCKKDKIIFIKV